MSSSGSPVPVASAWCFWAVGAGLHLGRRMTLTAGVALTEGAAALDPAALRAADIVIIDERAWGTLDAAQKKAVAAAVRDGLGLLLHMTGLMPAPVAADWAALGFELQVRDALHAVALDQMLDYPIPNSNSRHRRSLSRQRMQRHSCAPTAAHRSRYGAPMVTDASALGRLG